MASMRVRRRPPPVSARRSTIRRQLLVLGQLLPRDSQDQRQDRNKHQEHPPTKTPNTTGSSLRFGLNVEPQESFASSGRSGS